MNETQSNQFNPDYVSPPGETLLEAINERGISQAELADRTGRPKKTISEIINGKAELTPETALQLEHVLGIPAHFWNNRERRYREALARIQESQRLQQDVEYLKRIPYAALVKASWLSDTNDPVERLRAVLSFFGVASVSALENWAAERSVNFRQSGAFRIQEYAVLAWIRKGEIDAQHVRCEAFDEQTFRQALSIIRQLTREPANVFKPAMKQLCAKAGVAIVFVPELPGTRVWGATQWISPTKALVQLSLRYKTDDHLWFTFFHECGHILRHGKKKTFIEAERDSAEEDEKEADAFAENFLIPPARMAILRSVRPRSKQEIEFHARELEISPGIVVGRLQHDGLLPLSHLNGLKRRVEFA